MFASGNVDSPDQTQRNDKNPPIAKQILHRTPRDRYELDRGLDPEARN
jgi:hypothetical protein